MFCCRRNQLRALMENEIKELVANEALKFAEEGMSLEEMVKQQTEESGSFNGALTAAIEKFTNRTENTEVYIALELSTLYNFGPPDEILICFEMKKGFSGKISRLSDLTANMESATHIDCAIRSKTKEWHFQIKRYPSEHLEFTQEAIIAYLREIFGKYGGMKGTNLVMLLQPSGEAATAPLNLEKIHQALVSMREVISFDEIAVTFNANNRSILLARVFPDFQIGSKPLQFRSEKYQEEQREWERRMRKHQESAESSNIEFEG